MISLCRNLKSFPLETSVFSFFFSHCLTWKRNIITNTRSHKQSTFKLINLHYCFRFNLNIWKIPLLKISFVYDTSKHARHQAKHRYTLTEICCSNRDAYLQPGKKFYIYFINQSTYFSLFLVDHIYGKEKTFAFFGVTFKKSDSSGFI